MRVLFQIRCCGGTFYALKLFNNCIGQISAVCEYCECRMRQRTKNVVSLYVGDFGGMNSESLFASDCEPVIPRTFDRSFDTRHCWNIDTGIALSKVSAYVSLSIILFFRFQNDNLQIVFHIFLIYI